MIFVTKPVQQKMQVFQKLNDTQIQSFHVKRVPYFPEHYFLFISFYRFIINLMPPRSFSICINSQIFNLISMIKFCTIERYFQFTASCFLGGLKITSTALLSLRETWLALNHFSQLCRSLIIYLLIVFSSLKVHQVSIINKNAL